MKKYLNQFLYFLYDNRNILFGLFLFIVDIIILIILILQSISPEPVFYYLLFILSFSPWVVFIISSQIENSKYKLLWHNKKNVELILQSLGVYKKYSYTSLNYEKERYDPIKIIDQYKIFLNYEKRKKSQVSNLFLSEKAKSSRNNYNFAVKQYSLIDFIKLYILISLCSECITSSNYKYTDELCQFAEYVYGNSAIECRYRLLYDDSKNFFVYIDEVFSQYISFSVYQKRKSISFENMILFAIDYYDYYKEYKSKEVFQSYYEDNIKGIDFIKEYNSGDYAEFAKVQFSLFV